MMSADVEETVLLVLFSGFLGFIAIVYTLAEAILENGFPKTREAYNENCGL